MEKEWAGVPAQVVPQTFIKKNHRTAVLYTMKKLIFAWMHSVAVHAETAQNESLYAMKNMSLFTLKEEGCRKTDENRDQLLGFCGVDDADDSIAFPIFR